MKKVGKYLAKSLGKLAFLLITLLLFSACLTLHLGMYSYTHHPTVDDATTIYPVYLDATFGDADQIEIVKALDQWNYVFNGHAKFVVVNKHFTMTDSLIQESLRNDGFVIFKVPYTNSLVAREDDHIHKIGKMPNSFTLGFVLGVGWHQLYLVRDRLGNQDVFYITLHELGHALGAVHSNDGLMSPVYNRFRYQCVDQEAAKQIARVHHWEMSDLNYCY